MSILDRFSLEGKSGIVTGGGQNLGRAYCLALAEAGADVAVAEIDPGTGAAVAKEVAGVGRKGLFVEADVRSRDSVEAMTARVREAFGRIDFLVNNAGMWKFSPAEDLSDADWHEVMTLNLDGTFLCSRAVGRTMLEQGAGSIINISSVSGVIVNKPHPVTLDASYFASKAGVIHLTRALATQWTARGVRVNALAPGYTGEIEGEPPAFVEDIPAGRPGRLDEIAAIVVFLASDAASYLTGAVLVADGGVSCW